MSEIRELARQAISRGIVVHHDANGGMCGAYVVALDGVEYAVDRMLVLEGLDRGSAEDRLARIVSDLRSADAN